MRGRVVVRVVHVRADVAVGNRELVREALTRLHWWLRNERDTVHVVRQLHAVEVDRGGLRQLVLEVHAYAIPLANADLRTRHLLVVRHRIHDLARRHLPLHLARREVVDLHAVLHARRHELVPLAGGLGGERLDALFVHRVHEVGGGADRGGRRGNRSGSGRPGGRGHTARRRGVSGLAARHQGARAHGGKSGGTKEGAARRGSLRERAQRFGSRKLRHGLGRVREVVYLGMSPRRLVPEVGEIARFVPARPRHRVSVSPDTARGAASRPPVACPS